MRLAINKNDKWTCLDIEPRSGINPAVTAANLANLSLRDMILVPYGWHEGMYQVVDAHDNGVTLTGVRCPIDTVRAAQNVL